jgi:hypothetical protein
MVATCAITGYLISLAIAVLLIGLSAVESKSRVSSKSSRPADKNDSPNAFIEQLSGNEAFEQALHFFDDKNYKDAAEFFWAAVLKGGESFTVWFDLT